MTCAALAGYYYHQRMEQIYTNFEIDETVIRAGEILNTQGYSGLKIWLKKKLKKTFHKMCRNSSMVL
jgi:hypothetical protein